MTHPISAEVKERVVREHIAGSGRNQLSKSLGLSRGSVTNILKAWKCSAAKDFTDAFGIPKRDQISVKESVSFMEAPLSSQKEGPGAQTQALETLAQVPAPEPGVLSSMDWELDLGWARIFEEAKEAKGQTRDELLLIERERRHLELEKLEFRAKQDAFALHVKQQEEKRLVAFMLWAAKKGYMLFK